MSVSKPFVFALVSALGAERRAEIGVNATGLPFDSLAAIERGPGGRTNPMVNAGAIATTSLVPGTTADGNGDSSRGLVAFAGRTLSRSTRRCYASASTSNDRNRRSRPVAERRIAFDTVEAIDLYTRQSSLSVTARDLAAMGATLADGGVNPPAKERVVASERHMALARDDDRGALRETSGDWLYTTSACPARAASGEASSPLRRARAGSVHLRRRSTRRGTASRAVGGEIPVPAARPDPVIPAAKDGTARGLPGARPAATAQSGPAAGMNRSSLDVRRGESRPRVGAPGR